jgi:hypothetical protein
MAGKYADPQGRHARVYCTLLDSPAWRCLGWSARALFMDLRASLGKTNNGDLSATLSTLKHRGWRSPSTLARALQELQALGFIVKTRGGGVETGSKVCALYAFTDVDVLAFPGKGIPAAKAMHQYMRFKSVAEAAAALEQGVQQLRAANIERKQRAAARGNSTLQKSKRHATESVVMTARNDTASVAEAPPTLRKLKRSPTHRIAREPA